MGILKRAADAVYAIRFLRLLVMNWTSMKAYKLGLVDENGKKLRSPETDEEKSQYTLFHRLVYNVKRLLSFLPSGMVRKIGSLASALYLIKEHTNLSEEDIMETLSSHFDLDESVEEEFVLEENRRYQLNKDVIIPTNIDMVASQGSTITIHKLDGSIFGLKIYEATHNLTNKLIYVSSNDISADLNEEEFSVTTTDVAIPPLPLPMKTDMGDKYQRFTVPTGVFQKFDRGRKKFQRWSVFLDLNDEKQLQISQFAKKYRKSLIILQDESTGAMRAVRPTSSDGR